MTEKRIEIDGETVDRLTEGVETMAEAAGSLVKELKRHRVRTMTDKVFMWFMALGLVTLSVVSVLGFQEWKRDRQNVQDARIGVACVLELVQEHRIAQQAAHQAQAEQSGFSYEVPSELRPPTPDEVRALKERLDKACNQFTRTVP